MLLKIPFLHSYLDFVPGDLGNSSDDYGEGFQQDLKFFDQNYEGYWDRAMLSDYCWSTVKDTDTKKYKIVNF